MNKIIKIVKSVGYHDCELCGFSSEYSTQIHYEGWSYGEIAYAHCYDGRSTEADVAFEALLSHLDLPPVPVTEARPYASEQEYLNHIRGFGFTFEIEEAEEDEEYLESLYQENGTWYESEYDEED